MYVIIRTLSIENIVPTYPPKKLPNFEAKSVSIQKEVLKNALLKTMNTKEKSPIVVKMEIRTARNFFMVIFVF